MRAQREYPQNNVNKRGLVVDRDPKKHRIKVKFDDEDETTSMWIDVLSSSSGTTKTFMMPDEGDEVWCALDAKGEDGCLMGAKYNDQDGSPRDSNDDISLEGPWGSIHIDKAGGGLTLNLTGTVTVSADGGIKLEGPTLTHNDTDISDDHKHRDVTPGGALTGVPV